MIKIRKRAHPVAWGNGTKRLQNGCVRPLNQECVHRYKNKKCERLKLRRNKSSPILSSLNESEEKIKAKKGFINRLKINNRRRRKSGVFSKLFDRFSSSKKKRDKNR